MDSIDVVIPARNEAENIGAVISVLKLHPGIGHIIVVVDKDTTDNTDTLAHAAGALTIDTGTHGKGQCVTIGLKYVETDYVLFCDADVKGLTYDHISILICDAIMGADTMTIGVPDIPRNYPTERIWAWPWVSGQRCVPTKLVRPMLLLGYLMETQINLAAKNAGMGLRLEWLKGLTSSYFISEKRIQEMERDAEIGLKLGILL